MRHPEHKNQSTTKSARLRAGHSARGVPSAPPSPAGAEDKAQEWLYVASHANPGRSSYGKIVRGRQIICEHIEGENYGKAIVSAHNAELAAEYSKGWHEGVRQVSVKQATEIKQLREQPAGAADKKEWTPSFLSRLFDAECSPEEAIKRICALHDASIAAEREELAIMARSRDAWQRQVGAHGKTIQQLREQLAALQASIRDHNIEAENEQYSCPLIKIGTAAVDVYVAEAYAKGAQHQHGEDLLTIAEAVKPYVELLKQYMTAMDGIYNHNEASRFAVVKYFGTTHPPEAHALLSASVETDSPNPPTRQAKPEECPNCGRLLIDCNGNCIFDKDSWKQMK